MAVLLLDAGIVAIGLAPSEFDQLDQHQSIGSTGEYGLGAALDALPNFQVLAANDLGMHCGNLDQRSRNATACC
jgi:hypothetical protein